MKFDCNVYPDIIYVDLYRERTALVNRDSGLPMEALNMQPDSRPYNNDYNRYNRDNNMHMEEVTRGPGNDNRGPGIRHHANRPLPDMPPNSDFRYGEDGRLYKVVKEAPVNVRLHFLSFQNLMLKVRF